MMSYKILLISFLSLVLFSCQSTISTDYLIEEHAFQGFVIGEKIPADASNLEKDVLVTGEGNFDIFYIKSAEEERLAYIFPTINDETIIGDITINSPLAYTKDGIKVGMTYGEMEKLISDFEVHGSEMESRTHVTHGKFKYRLNVANNTYEVDKNTIPKTAKITQIIISNSSPPQSNHTPSHR